jgi:nucleoid-associated protein YgaU
MGLFKKDDPGKKKPDFSNVKSGSSTAPKAPAPPAAPSAPAAPAARGADFANVRSGSSSTAPTLPPAEKPVTRYTVKSGDSLSKIAKRFYGDAKMWNRIYEANRELIGKNPDLIQPGQDLVIPQD